MDPSMGGAAVALMFSEGERTDELSEQPRKRRNSAPRVNVRKRKNPYDPLAEWNRGILGFMSQAFLKGRCGNRYLCQ